MNTANEHFQNENEQMEMRLWDYIDGLSSEDERSLINQLLVDNKEWQEKYNELLQFHSALDLTQLEEPSMRFTKNVMEAIANTHIAPAAKSYINQKLIWSITAFFITIIAGFTIYAFAQADGFSEPVQETAVNFSEINYSKVFDSTYVNLFIIINVVLGLLLFDRYLNKRNKQLA